MLAFVPIGVGLTEETPATPTDIEAVAPIVMTIDQIEEVPEEEEEIIIEEQEQEQEILIETQEAEVTEEDITEAEEIAETTAPEEIIEEPMEEPIEEAIIEPIEESIEDPIIRTVKLYASWENQECTYLGDEITLWFVTEGFDDVSYMIQWEYSENGIDFFAIKNANDQTYKFIIDEINCNYYWRVKLTIIT